MALSLYGEGPRGPRRGAKGSCGTPGNPCVRSPGGHVDEDPHERLTLRAGALLRSHADHRGRPPREPQQRGRAEEAQLRPEGRARDCPGRKPPKRAVKRTLRAHTKAPYESDLRRETLRALSRPLAARTVRRDLLRRLGETGPLSQGVQVRRKALRIRHINA